MATMQTKTSYDNTGWDLGGRAVFNDDITVKQDAGRTTGDLLFLTIMAREAVSQKLIPLTDINPALTAASMLCGANGGNLAAWQAVGDGSLTIVVDGTSLDVTGLVFTGITALTDIAGIINIGLALRALCFYDEVGDAFTFVSPKTGLPASSVTVLTAGSAGTDVTGTGFLNGLTTVGTVTAATGEESTAIPAGIFGSEDVLEADIIAGDVDDMKVMTSGEPKYFNEEKIVLENSLALDDVIPATGKTIRYMLHELGLVIMPTSNTEQIAPVN